MTQDETIITVTPGHLGLPHKVWRPSQYLAYKKVLGVHEEGGGTIILELAAGVGKSAVSTALSASAPVTALVQNLGLLDQYASMYGFDIVKGKNEYDCVLKPKVESWFSLAGTLPKASDCHFSNMRECPSSNLCPYLIARNKMLLSKKGACTYRYASLSESVSKREGILVLDECHLSPDEILSTAKFTMDDGTRKRFNFDDFPLPMYGEGGDGDILTDEDKGKLIIWLTKCAQLVSNIDLFDTMTPKAAAQKRITEELQYGMNILNQNDTLFYTCKLREYANWNMDKNGLELCVRPIDPKQAVKNLTRNKQTVMLMSATIGNPAPLAKELGLYDYKFYTYPHPVPIDARPVYDLHVNKMTKAEIDKNPELYRIQANAIICFIKKLDPSWRILIVTSSNKKIDQLRGFIKERLGDRLFEQPKMKVSERVNGFISDTTPGKIVVDTIQGFGTGIDLHDDIARVSIMAGIAYPNPGDRYEQARMSRDGGSAFSFWKAYSGVPQATGRVSRGEKTKDGGWLKNVGAIADGSAMSGIAMSHYPIWFKESLVS